MSDTTLKAAPAPVTAVSAAPPATPPAATPGRAKHPVVLVLETVGSLRITVTLFVLSLILVFFGTLAQIDGGIWNVMDKYFRAYFVWIPVQLLVQFGQVFLGVSKDFRVSSWWVIPFPGGFTIGAALLLNLVAAYSLRIPAYFKRWKNYALMGGVCAAICVAGYVAVTNLSQWGFLIALACILAVAVAVLAPFRKMIFFPGNRIGIITLHVGLVVMLVGEFITGYGAIEGNMVIEEGETTNAVLHNRYYELAFVDASDPKEDAVTVIPGRLLKPGKSISDPRVPCVVEVVSWMGNSDLSDVEKDDTRENPSTIGAGLKHLAIEHKEVSGTATKQTVDTPSAYVKLTDKETGKELGVYLLSVLLKDQTLTLGGKEYDVSLRFKHTYKPYSLRLEEFRFDRYEGTDTPKNFSSKVRLHDEQRGDDREVTIRMNEPLRHRGDTFFQADWNKKTEKGTVLQVVRNPAWQLPYWSCAIVTLGMLMHFGLNLVNFLGRRAGE
jgi:hypothetical protein